MEILVFGKDQENGQFVDGLDEVLDCYDGHKYQLMVSDLVRAGESVDQCVMCGHSEFYRVKDFPRALGILIVLITFVAFFFTPGPLKYIWLFVGVALDRLAFWTRPWKLVCYVCDSQYRKVKPSEAQQEYDLEHATECKRKRWLNRPIDASEPSSEA